MVTVDFPVEVEYQGRHRRPGLLGWFVGLMRDAQAMSIGITHEGRHRPVPAGMLFGSKGRTTLAVAVAAAVVPAEVEYSSISWPLWAALVAAGLFFLLVHSLWRRGHRARAAESPPQLPPAPAPISRRCGRPPCPGRGTVPVLEEVDTPVGRRLQLTFVCESTYQQGVALGWWPPYINHDPFDQDAADLVAGVSDYLRRRSAS